MKNETLRKNVMQSVTKSAKYDNIWVDMILKCIKKAMLRTLLHLHFSHENEKTDYGILYSRGALKSYLDAWPDPFGYDSSFAIKNEFFLPKVW